MLSYCIEYSAPDPIAAANRRQQEYNRSNHLDSQGLPYPIEKRNAKGELQYWT